jgi:hypothetical protein
MHTDGATLASARLTMEEANALRASTACVSSGSTQTIAQETSASTREIDSVDEYYARQPTPVPSDDEDLDDFQKRLIGWKNRKGSKKGRARGLVTALRKR